MKDTASLLYNNDISDGDCVDCCRSVNSLKYIDIS